MADTQFGVTIDTRFKDTTDTHWSYIAVWKERDILYDRSGWIDKERSIVYDLVLELSKERSILYDSILELSKERDILYDLTLELSKTRDILYDSILELSKGRNVVYDAFGIVSKERNVVYDLYKYIVTFGYILKIYNTAGAKVAEISGDYQNVTLTKLEFTLLKQGGCGAFSFTLAEPYTQAVIDKDYRVGFYFFSRAEPWFTGKILRKPIEGTKKEMTYSGWGYFNELEKKIINTEITPGQNITTAVETILGTDIVPYTSILKNASLLEQVAGHTLVATIDVNDEYAKWVFDRLSELAVDYKFGVNADREFYFQPIDTSVKEYWHIGKHLTDFEPEEDPSGIVKKVIAVCDPQLFSDGYELKVTSQTDDYAGLYEKRFSVPQIISPFSETNIALGKTVSTWPTGSGKNYIVDGNYATLWVSGQNQASGHRITIDLGEDYENISMVIIDSIHDNAKEYNAKSVNIRIMPDGGSYATVIESDEDIGWKPEITFRPTKGRYIKIALPQASDEQWKVGQVEIYQLNLTDAQRWADGVRDANKDAKKRATARIAGVDKLIEGRSGIPILPSGKARIFDRNGTKIDDYQMVGCRYSLSPSGMDLDLELGEEERTIADELKDLERRIREAESTDVRRAKNLSLSKGFQLSQIKGTYIGPDTIETKHFRAKSITAEQYYELRNTYVFSDQDSLDAGPPPHPLEMLFKIVSEMTAIQSVKLSFKIRNFRAYAKGVPSGGGHTTPSGGGATSGSKGTPSGGGSTSGSATHNHPGSTAESAGAEAHRHKVTIYEESSLYMQVGWQGGHFAHDFRGHGDKHPISGLPETWVGHSHGLNITGDGAHSHSTPNHTHPNHTHSTPSHTHTVSNHTHSLTFGIYEDSQSPTINIWIDNGSGYGNSIGSYNSDTEDIDITAHISGTGFKQVKFTSNKRTRISAFVLCKVDLTA